MKIKSHARFLRKRSAVAVSGHWVQGQADGWRSRVASTLGIWQLDAACAAVVHPAQPAQSDLTSLNTRIAKDAVQLRGYVDLARSHPRSSFFRNRVKVRCKRPQSAVDSRPWSERRHPKYAALMLLLWCAVAGTARRYRPGASSTYVGEAAQYLCELARFL